MVFLITSCYFGTASQPAILITTEPAILVRERARRTVCVEEREAHGLTCGLLDGARALEVADVRRSEARARSVDLDACGLEIQSEGERDRVEDSLGCAVLQQMLH